MAGRKQELGRFGAFQVKSKIGVGPRGTVYKVEKEGQLCALKILKESTLPEDLNHRNRLKRVLKRLPRIDHPAVVRVLEVGEQKGRLYVAMELMECPTLQQSLALQKRLPEQDVMLFSRQIAQALEAGQALNLTHGDLVPQNVFVAASNRIKVSDFAIKKYIEEAPKDGDLLDSGPWAVDQQRQEEWSTAEALLRSRSSGVNRNLQRDLGDLAVLMMRMSGASVPQQEVDEPLEQYCHRLYQFTYGPGNMPSGFSPLTVEMVRRLLIPNEFHSAAAVTVEMASTTVFQRVGLSSAAASGREETQTHNQDSPRAQGPAEPARPQPQASGPATAEEEADKTEKEPETELVIEPAADVLSGEATAFFVWHGESRGEFFVLRDGEELMLGRDPDQCHFAIPDGTISRKHCVLSKKGDKIRVEDAGSANGTYVNDRQVKSTELAAGDIIQIGGCKISVAVSFPEK